MVIKMLDTMEEVRALREEIKSMKKTAKKLESVKKLLEIAYDMADDKDLDVNITTNFRHTENIKMEVRKAIDNAIDVVSKYYNDMSEGITHKEGKVEWLLEKEKWP